MREILLHLPLIISQSGWNFFSQFPSINDEKKNNYCCIFSRACAAFITFATSTSSDCASWPTTSQISSWVTTGHVASTITATLKHFCDGNSFSGKISKRIDLGPVRLWKSLKCSSQVTGLPHIFIARFEMIPIFLFSLIPSNYACLLMTLPKYLITTEWGAGLKYCDC